MRTGVALNVGSAGRIACRTPAGGTGTIQCARQRHLALRVRALLDMLKQTYARPDYWSPATMPGRAEANSPQSS